jgi:type IV pilus assembly protein PilO
MALIPTDPKQKNAFFVALGAVVLAFGLDYLYLSAQRTELATEKERLETLETSNRQAQLTAARGGGQIEERLAAYERHVMTLEQLIPASDEVPALLREITSQARQIIGSDPAQFRPEPDEPGEFYTKKAYQMQAIGDYHAIARFLTAVASLSRIITPVDVTITSYDGQQTGVTTVPSPVVVDFRIETYVLPPPSAETPGAPPAQVGSL